MTRRALVTGSAGFLGGHFYDRLKTDGWDVLGLDVIEGQDCRRWFDDPKFTERWDLVVHCAAIVGGRKTIEGQPLRVAQDLGIDAAMFAWAARTGQPHVIYPSSSAAYPIHMQTEGLHRPLRESDIELARVQAPDLTYGWTKITGEILARHARAQGVRVHVIRPFSGYGADQSPDYPFRAYIDRAIAREDPFPVWGDGLQTRDFIHVSDIVEAALVMVEAGIEGPVNLGTGIATTFRELARLCCEAVGYRPTFDFRLTEPEGVRHRVADISRLSRFYRPKVSLAAGVDAAIAAVTTLA